MLHKNLSSSSSSSSTPKQAKQITQKRHYDSFYEFFKKAYPLDNLKRVVEEVMIGAPSFLTGYALNAAAIKASSILFPHMTQLQKPAITTPEKPAAWHSYQPLNIMIKKKYITPATALRFHAPISEELAFRGLLMPAIQKKLEASGVSEKPAKVASIVGNSLLFSAMHPKANRKAFFLSSLVYSTLTHYADGSLIPATTAHMANNHIALKLAKTTLAKK